MSNVVLLIIDGYGIAPHNNGNMIDLAKTPNLRKLMSRYPTMALSASGEDVGLSVEEVPGCDRAHLTIGTGRTIYNNKFNINCAIKDLSFYINDTLLKTINHVKTHNTNLHLIGVLNKDSLYGDVNHLYALLYLSKRQGIRNVYIHGIIEGDHNDSVRVFKSVTETLARIKKIGVGCVVTLSGSFYAMDRFNYWNRVEKSYNTMVNSQSRYTFSNPLNAIEDSYGKGLSASDFVPTSILYEDSKTPISISDNDGVIFCNYRGDSLRALVTAFTQNDFDKFPTGQLNNVFVATMTEYGAGPNIHVAYKESIVGESLAKIISDNNMSQLHLASPEKYPYVTHYFNGCQDTLFPMSDNILIDVKIDKIQNEAKEISKKIITAIEKKSYNFIVANFSAIDVVAHTGDIKKTISAIETVDKYIGDIMESLLMNNFTAIIASDHGYSENLLDANTETINKGHSNNLVPFIVISRELEGKTGGVEQVENDLSALPVSGTLKDVAPTILKLLDIKDARGMEGRSII